MTLEQLVYCFPAVLGLAARSNQPWILCAEPPEIEH